MWARQTSGSGASGNGGMIFLREEFPKLILNRLMFREARKERSIKAIIGEENILTISEIRAIFPYPPK
jgi:hypothetical protein